MKKKMEHNDTPLFERERYESLVRNINEALARMQEIENEIQAEKAERKWSGRVSLDQFKPTRKKRGTK
jgi:hypothetical protein